MFIDGLKPNIKIEVLRFPESLELHNMKLNEVRGLANRAEQIVDSQLEIGSTSRRRRPKKSKRRTNSGHAR